MKKLFVVGIGPGDAQYLTPQARQALNQSQHVVGYSLYVDLLAPVLAQHQCHRFAIGEEQQRVDHSLKLALQGEITSLVSSGDAGIYAMASLLLETLQLNYPDGQPSLAIEFIPGISAMQVLASRVGAPLGHDFCVISLSDLLTPWSVIEQRLHSAGSGDFICVLYNPASRQRRHPLEQAQHILLQYRHPDTPVALGKNLSRPGEKIIITTLKLLDFSTVDMLTVLIIGNSQTRNYAPWLYTPRGYTHDGNE